MAGVWLVRLLWVFSGYLVGFILFYLFIYFYCGFLVLVGFCWAEGSGGMVGMVVAWWALFV